MHPNAFARPTLNVTIRRVTVHHWLILVPLLALLLFVFLPWQVAVAAYVPVLAVVGYIYCKIRQAQHQPAVMGEESMIGGRAIVVSTRRGEIEVHFQGETWHAVSSQPVQRGQEVIIEGVDGLTLHVVPAENPAGGTPRAA
jgi:membrane protein implicated in regulation of membrane protease activity